MTKTHKAIILFLQGAMFSLALFLIFYSFVHPEYNKIGGTLAGIVLPFLPQIIAKIFKIKLTFTVQFVYLAFLFVALFLGINFDFYKTVPYFDKITHLASGVLSVLLGHFTLHYFKATNTKKLFQAIFIIFMSITIAVLWEFFEFACDKLLGQSMQQLISIGVDDTMYDLLAATGGAIIGTIISFRTKIVASTIDKQVPKR